VPPNLTKKWHRDKSREFRDIITTAAVFVVSLSEIPAKADKQPS
jgi:hypothetical protein